ncbi:MAG: class I SAM-dependent methyltransferase [Chloroflexi bacterium]|nr:class I SAM-dependent methyltransferase [Chloroflexota bacterium]
MRVPDRMFNHCRRCDLRWVELSESTETLSFDLTHYRDKLEFRGWSFEASVLEYMKLFAELPHSSGERFLEIGPGNGEVLEAAHRLGLRCTAFDVDESALSRVQHVSDVELIAGSLSRESFGERTYDIIFSNNVIEHVPRPIEFLRGTRALLANGGRVWVSCPNVASYEARILHSYWPQYAPVDHVRLYSPRALAWAMERAGLEVDRVWTGEGDFDFPLTMLAGARNFLLRKRALNGGLSANAYGGGAPIPKGRPLRTLMTLVYKGAPVLGIPFAYVSPRFGAAQHLRALASKPRKA